MSRPPAPSTKLRFREKPYRREGGGLWEGKRNRFFFSIALFYYYSFSTLTQRPCGCDGKTDKREGNEKERKEIEIYRVMSSCCSFLFLSICVFLTFPCPSPLSIHLSLSLRWQKPFLFLSFSFLSSFLSLPLSCPFHLMEGYFCPYGYQLTQHLPFWRYFRVFFSLFNFPSKSYDSISA